MEKDKGKGFEQTENLFDYSIFSYCSSNIGEPYVYTNNTIEMLELKAIREFQTVKVNEVKIQTVKVTITKVLGQ